MPIKKYKTVMYVWVSLIEMMLLLFLLILLLKMIKIIRIWIFLMEEYGIREENGLQIQCWNDWYPF